ncbi:MAG TPA: tetratricopeptide repeat protein [Bryobacteraceae bacterium]|nr:tetratricopeptide repeat protein [Bryobacteraceae bacterium]
MTMGSDQTSTKRIRIAPLMALAAIAVLLLSGCSTDPRRGKEMFLNSGLRYMQKGKYQESIIQFQNALKLDPHCVEAMAELGQAHIANHEWSDAFATLQQAMQLDPMRADVRLSLGRLFLSARDYERAEQEAQAVLKQDPRNAGAYQLLGASLVVKQDYGRARETFRKLIELLPQDANSHMNLALVDVALGHYGEAEQGFREAVALDPLSAKAYANCATFYRLIGQPDHALEILRQGARANLRDPALSFLLVDFLHARRQDAEATQVIDALRRQSGPPEILDLVIGDYYLSRGMTDQAGAEFRRAFVLAPGNSEVQKRMVAWLLSRGQPDQAEDLNNRILHKHPKDGAAGVAKGRILLARGKADEAINELRHQVSVDPISPDAHFYLAMAYRQRDRLGQARQELNETARLAPDRVAALRSLTEVSLAMNNTQAAIEAAQRAVQIAPMSFAERTLLGSAFLRAGNPAKAEAEFLFAQRLNPGDPSAGLSLAQVYAAKNEWAAAEEQLQQLLRANPNYTPALAELADQWGRRRNQMAKALSLAESYAGAHPSDGLAFLVLGSLQLAAKEYGNASQNLTRASELDPKMVQVPLRLGQLAQERHDPDGAIHQYELALKLTPRSAALKTLLGNLYQSRGRIVAARAAYRDALAIDPNFGIAAGNLAWMEAEHGGDLNIALSLARRARELLPGHTAITDTLAWIDYKKGVYTSSVELLKECVQKSPESSLFRYHLGMALLASGDKVHARSELRAAVALGAQGPDGQQALRALTTLSTQ